MRSMIKPASLLTALALAVAVIATTTDAAPKQKMQKLTIGEAAPTFTLADADGNDVSLADFRGKITVLHFQSCKCPWDVAYQAQLNSIAEKYATAEHDGKTVHVQFVGINSNKAEDYKMIAKYNQKASIPYPVLKDPGNKVADAYAAKTTPHMYIIDQQGVLRYQGGIEKAPARLKDVSKMDQQYLEPALKALIAGTEPTHTDTTPKGCSIKRVKK